MNIKDKKTIDEVIKDSLVCRIALSDNNSPYLVPVCFGYDGDNLYFHGKPAGKKIDILKKNNSVCFEFDSKVTLLESPMPCKWDVKYKSVIGFGKTSFMDNIKEKKHALNCIMKQYSQDKFDFIENVIEKTTLIKIKIEDMTLKTSGFNDKS